MEKSLPNPGGQSWRPCWLCDTVECFSVLLNSIYFSGSLLTCFSPLFVLSENVHTSRSDARAQITLMLLFQRTQLQKDRRTCTVHIYPVCPPEVFCPKALRDMMGQGARIRAASEGMAELVPAATSVNTLWMGSTADLIPRIPEYFQIRRGDPLRSWKTSQLASKAVVALSGSTACCNAVFEQGCGALDRQII